ncbi:MAG: 16S rRNA (uracil(1498)-N(3))-methyltransferase [Clostridia bacterium]|nr:16S rRNA (uracil(1498)-N(3))-methyltransferase [Clostridia bacterium]
MEKRFFAQKENIFKNQITLTGEEHNHLAKVMRLRIGDKVECFFDSSEVFLCEIIEILKDKSLLKIESSSQSTANPKMSLTLFQGLPKLDKLEFISQKLCEIGASEIVPFSSKFTIAKENENKLERLYKINVSACKQCGRTSLLKVSKTLKFNEMCQRLKDFDKVIFANEKENFTTLKSSLNTLNSSQKIAVVVGSEGGFSTDEIDTLCSLKNVTSVSLGRRILRTETASLVLCGCVATWLED